MPWRRSQNSATNIDIICVGVEYMSLPRYLRNLDIVEPTDVEIRQLEEMLGKPLTVSSVRMFVADTMRFPIVAARFKVAENESDIFDSPFEK